MSVPTLAGITEKGTNFQGLAKSIKTKGMEATGLKVDYQSIKSLPLPAIVHLNHLDKNHFVVLQKVNKSNINYIDNGKSRTMLNNEFQKRFTGYTLLVYPKDEKIYGNHNEGGNARKVPHVEQENDQPRDGHS